jgi:hypothetical protein
MAKKRSIDEINDDYRIDDRWTETKLIAAGYEFRGDGPCKTCGESVSFYKRERAGDYKGYAKWKVVDSGSLGEHHCQGRK